MNNVASSLLSTLRAPLLAVNECCVTRTSKYSICSLLHAVANKQQCGAARDLTVYNRNQAHGSAMPPRRQQHRGSVAIFENSEHPKYTIRAHILLHTALSVTVTPFAATEYASTFADNIHVYLVFSFFRREPEAVYAVFSPPTHMKKDWARHTAHKVFVGVSSYQSIMYYISHFQNPSPSERVRNLKRSTRLLPPVCTCIFSSDKSW